MDPFSPETPSQPLPKFPLTVRVAAVIWIVVGGTVLVALFGILAVGVYLISRPDFVPEYGARSRLDVCLFLGVVATFLGAFGGGFTLLGVRTWRGTAGDTLLGGIVSIGFGVYSAMPRFIMRAFVMPALTPHNLAGALLLAAGILALLGRSQYKAWRTAHKTIAGPSDLDVPEHPSKTTGVPTGPNTSVG